MNGKTHKNLSRKVVIFTATTDREELISQLMQKLKRVPDEVIEGLISLLNAYLRSRKELHK